MDCIFVLKRYINDVFTNVQLFSEKKNAEKYINRFIKELNDELDIKASIQPNDKYDYYVVEKQTLYNGENIFTKYGFFIELKRVNP